MRPSDDFVSIKELSERLGMDRSHARRYVLKSGFHPYKRRTRDSQNQLTLCLTEEEAQAILAKRGTEGFRGTTVPVVSDVGVFYVIQLVPELDPCRIKLGFAIDLLDRLSQHRTAAPTAVVMKSWPCKRTWEQTVMDCLTSVGCRLLLNEVFECDDPSSLVQRGESLFSILPDPKAKPELAETSPLRGHTTSGGA